MSSNKLKVVTSAVDDLCKLSADKLLALMQEVEDDHFLEALVTLYEDDMCWGGNSSLSSKINFSTIKKTMITLPLYSTSISQDATIQWQGWVKATTNESSRDDIEHSPNQHPQLPVGDDCLYEMAA